MLPKIYFFFSFSKQTREHELVNRYLSEIAFVKHNRTLKLNNEQSWLNIEYELEKLCKQVALSIIN